MGKFEFLPNPIEKHFIGHLQMNKARAAIRLFDMIHSIDRLELAEELGRCATRWGLEVPILIEVNPSPDPGRHGVTVEACPDLVAAISECPGLRITGLMTMPPYSEAEAEIRGHFRAVRACFEALAEQRIKNVEMRYLSMGISHDFEIAIEEGANLVRIGTGIFGGRRY